MTSMELTALWIGIAALAALILFTILYIVWKRSKQGSTRHTKEGRQNHSAAKNPKNKGNSNSSDGTETKSSKKNEAEQKVYSVNERLDGARVSHRRSHPDRIAQETEWKERREQEISEISRQKLRESKNNLFMIYSPCNGDVAAIFESMEDAKKYQLTMPGVIITPNDHKLYAPVNGVISWLKPNENKILLQSEEGTEILITVQRIRNGNITIHPEEDQEELLTNQIPEGTVVKCGEAICHLAQGLIKKADKKTDKRVLIAMIIHNYEEGQMVLSKRVSYLLHGDKILTLRKKP